jgi:hypothetical protein
MSSQIIGVDVTEQHTSPKFTLGSKYVSPEGNTYRYVSQTAAARTIGLVYGISEVFAVSTTGVVKTETHALLGIPQFTTTGAVRYFWIQTAGNFAAIETSAAAADNAGVYSTQTAGKVDDGDDSGKLIRGIIFTTAAGGAASTTAFAPSELFLAQA